MQKTVEHTGVDNGVSPAVIELLILERNKDKTLRQLGQMFGKSHERIRQILAQHDRSSVTLLSESRAAAKLRYPAHWLVKLRKKGILSPIKPGGHWLYSEEQVRQISSLLPRQEYASNAVSGGRLVLRVSVESADSIGIKISYISSCSFISVISSHE